MFHANRGALRRSRCKVNNKFKALLAVTLLFLPTGAGAQTSTPSATCFLTGNCDAEEGIKSTIEDIIDETKNCSVNVNPALCCPCSATEAALKNYMNIHRKGGAVGKDSFLFKTYWEGTVNPGLQKALSKIVQGTITQNTVQGSFIEAQNNVRAVSALQQASAQAARDYLPSESLCRFGTLSQSLGSDDIKSHVAQAAIAKASLKRNLGSEGSISQAGSSDEMELRMNEMVKENCDPSNPSMTLMCGKNSKRRFPDVPKDQRKNRDISYTKTIEDSATLNIDFAGTDASTPAEQDIIALAQNLYGHKQPSSRITEKKIRTVAGQDAYLQSRSVIASRSVASNTYAAIAGMKSRGSANVRPYMKAILQQLGADGDQVTAALGEKPSYYAQMDVLTKKLYQTPSFYANLMEGKTNVARQSGAMESLELMQDRDIYNSMRRSEMLLALLIQLQSKDELKDVATEQ